MERYIHGGQLGNGKMGKAGRKSDENIRMYEKATLKLN